MNDAPMDRSHDELADSTTRAMADTARAVISAEGVRWAKVQISALSVEDTRRFLLIKRAEADARDEKPYPLVSSPYEPAVGDWVHALETPGGLVILGKEWRMGDVSVPQLVDGTGMSDSSIRFRHHGAGEIGGDLIWNGGVVHGKVAENAITAYEIGTRVIKGENVAEDEITDYEIGVRVIRGANVAENAITDYELAVDAVVRANVDAGAIGFDEIGAGEVGGNRIWAGGVETGALAGGSVRYEKVGVGEIGGDRIWDGAITGGHIANGIKGPAQGSYGLRQLGSGNSVVGAGNDHVHSLSFKGHYSLDERERVIGLRREVRGQDASPLRDLVLELANMAMDDPHETAEEMQEKMRSDRAYYHARMMRHNPDYHARWMHEHDALYRASMGGAPKVRESLARRSRDEVVNDPEVVDAYRQRTGG
jgi:hypothetical protein